MKRCILGYIHNEKILTAEQKSFLKQAKKHSVEVEFINIGEDLIENKLEEKIKRCNILLNRTDEILAIEVVKTAEEMGKKVIDSSESFYYKEDKWMLYLRCRENKIPVPETVLLPDTFPAVKKELLEFNRWPVVLKRLDCSEGRFVEKAENINEALKIVKRYWKQSYERLPIIAQEFIKSYSYRVLIIDGKIVQTETKKGTGWKLTGVYIKRFYKFKIDKEIKQISKKLSEITKIKILGIDLVKRDKRWYVIDANSEPCFSDFESDLDMLVSKTITLLKKEASCQDKAS
jgi:glutathione synthase/RimK-type ligase-like ATP-grasp enzyme